MQCAARQAVGPVISCSARVQQPAALQSAAAFISFTCTASPHQRRPVQQPVVRNVYSHLVRTATRLTSDITDGLHQPHQSQHRTAAAAVSSLTMSASNSNKPARKATSSQSATTADPSAKRVKQAAVLPQQTFDPPDDRTLRHTDFHLYHCTDTRALSDAEKAALIATLPTDLRHAIRHRLSTRKDSVQITFNYIKQRLRPAFKLSVIEQHKVAIKAYVWQQFTNAADPPPSAITADSALSNHVLQGEVLLHIATYLHPLHIIAAAASSKAFNDAFTSDAAWENSVWEPYWMYKRHEELAYKMTKSRSESYYPQSLQKLRHLLFKEGNFGQWDERADAVFFSRLPVMPRLETLLNVHDMTERDVVKFPALKQLTLHSVRLTASLLTALSQLKQLKQLGSLGRTVFKTRDLAELALLTHTQTSIQYREQINELEPFDMLELLAAGHHLHKMEIILTFEQFDRFGIDLDVLDVPPASESRLRYLSICVCEERWLDYKQEEADNARREEYWYLDEPPDASDDETTAEEHLVIEQKIAERIIQLIDYHPGLTTVDCAPVNEGGLELHSDAAAILTEHCRQRRIKLLNFGVADQ